MLPMLQLFPQKKKCNQKVYDAKQTQSKTVGIITTTTMNDRQISLPCVHPFQSIQAPIQSSQAMHASHANEDKVK